MAASDDGALHSVNRLGSCGMAQLEEVAGPVDKEAALPSHSMQP